MAGKFYHISSINRKEGRNMSKSKTVGIMALIVFAMALAPTKAPTETNGNQVLLIANEQSDDMEFMLTKEVGVMVSMLEKAGFKVVVASASSQPIVGGIRTLWPDLKLADVKVDDYVGFILPCMGVPFRPELPPEAVRVVKEAMALGKPVAAQVSGVVTLGIAGVLDGKQFAMSPRTRPLVPGGGVYKGYGVVQDGNIITSGTCPFLARRLGRPDGTLELTRKLIDSLASIR
jgi:putative intracellular protease/amidase